MDKFADNTPNVLPTVATLAAMGGLAGLGGSLLSKRQRKNKWRNAAIGATAVPALFLAADKWGPGKTQDVTHAIKNKINATLPEKMVSFFGGADETTMGKAPAVGKELELAATARDDIYDALEKARQVPINANTWDYANNESLINSDYADDGLHAYNARDEFANKKRDVEKRKELAENTRKESRKTLDEQHKRKVDTATKQLQTLQDQDRVSAITRYENANKEKLKEDKGWGHYKSQVRNRDAQIGASKQQFGATDAANLTAKQKQLEHYKNTLESVKNNMAAGNPYEEELKAADSNVRALQNQIDNFEKSDEYRDISRQAKLEAAGIHAREAYSLPKEEYDKILLKAVEDAVAARKTALQNELIAAKQNLRNVKSEYSSAGWDKWFGSWDAAKKQKMLEGRIRKLNTEVQDLTGRQDLARTAETTANTRFKELLSQLGLTQYDDAVNKFLEDHEKAKKTQQAIIDSKPDYTAIENRYNADIGQADSALQQAIVERETELARIAAKLQELKEKKQRWDEEDIARDLNITDLEGEYLNAAQDASNKYQNYLTAEGENLGNIDKMHNRALAATGGGAGALILLSALNKLRKRRKQKISPEEYINYLEEEGLA